MCFSCRVRLLLIVIAAGASVSAETRKPIYHIRRYCKATSVYSPIRSIGLTLVFGNVTVSCVDGILCSLLEPFDSVSMSVSIVRKFCIRLAAAGKMILSEQ